MLDSLENYCRNLVEAEEVLGDLCSTGAEECFCFEVEFVSNEIKIISKYNKRTDILLKIWLFFSRELDSIDEVKFHSAGSCKYYPELKREPLIVDQLLKELGIYLIESKGDFVLTCDIDWPFFYPRTPSGYLRRMYHLFSGSYRGDLFDTYQHIIDTGREFLIPVKFFILPNGRGKHDPRIFEKRRLLKRLRKVTTSYDKVSFGIHIPLAPTSKYLKIVEWIGKELPLTGSRTHYLRRDDKIIAKSLGKMNSSYDYSAGYNDAPSTFYGTSIRVLSWKDYLLGNRIFKIPVYFMDVHLDYCGKLWSFEEFLKSDKEIIQKTGFKRLIIWHNDKFHESSIYYERMKSLINRLK